MKWMFLLLVSSALHAQDLPKKTNTIIVKGVQYENAVKLLLDEGYIIHKRDGEFQTAETEFMKITGMIHITLSIRIKDSAAIITGRWASELFSDMFLPIEKNNSKGGKITFAKMQDYALKLQGSDIAYETR